MDSLSRGGYGFSDLCSVLLFLQEAKRFAQQALHFLPLNPRGNANGTAAALHLTLALLGAARGSFCRDNKWFSVDLPMYGLL